MGIAILVVVGIAVVALICIFGGPSRYHCPECEAYWAARDAKGQRPVGGHLPGVIHR